MSKHEPRPATYADLEAVPPHLIAEIIGGRLATRRYFGPSDGCALTLFHHALGGPTLHDRRPEAPYVVLRPEVHVSGDVLVPELGMWRRGDMWAFEDWRDLNARPAWVLEWITPWSDIDDHTERCRVYARAGIGWLWRMDSVTSSLQIFHLDEASQWRLIDSFSPRDRVRGEPFQHVELDLAEIWAQPWLAKSTAYTCQPQADPILGSPEIAGAIIRGHSRQTSGKDPGSAQRRCPGNR